MNNHNNTFATLISVAVLIILLIVVFMNLPVSNKNSSSSDKNSSSSDKKLSSSNKNSSSSNKKSATEKSIVIDDMDSYVKLEPTLYKNTVTPVISEIAVEDNRKSKGWYIVPIETIMSNAGWNVIDDVLQIPDAPIKIWIFFKPIAQIRGIGVDVNGPAKKLRIDIGAPTGLPAEMGTNSPSNSMSQLVKLRDNAPTDFPYQNKILIEVTPYGQNPFNIKLHNLKIV